MWVGLDVLGRTLAWKPVAAGAREVVFELDAAALESRFATLRLRVADRSGAPIAGARATLRADTSAHRRADQARVGSDADGRIELARVVPGRYELVVESGEALHTARLDLAPGEHADLGTVVLRLEGGVDLQVLDTEGKGVRAWIQVGPWREGASASDLYPPNLNRLTSEDGRYRLPLPSSRAMVRAIPSLPEHYAQVEERSPSVLVDPDAPPRGAVVLVVGRTATLELAAADPGWFEVVDELGVVVHATTLRAGEVRGARLPPGRYRALRRLPGEPPRETSFLLGRDPLRVAAP
jgi:hypothetical protein